MSSAAALPRRRRPPPPARRRSALLASASALLAVLLLVVSTRSLNGAPAVENGPSSLPDQQAAPARKALRAANSSAAAAAAVAPLLTAAAPGQRPLRVLLVGHELTLTGAPLAMLEIAAHLRDRGHSVSFLFLRGGLLEPTLARAGFNYSFVNDVQVDATVRSAPVDPASFDVVVVNTVVTWRWIRHQVEAWGLPFLRRVVWWIRELPVGSAMRVAAYTQGGLLKRQLMARAAAVPCASEITWAWWEAWVLEQAYELGLDYSPLVARQESTGRAPPLPPALPSLRALRNPLPAWMMPLLEAGGGGGQPECSRASGAWPHADLRRELRARLGATEDDYVVLLVGTHAEHKGTARLVAAFARAWWQAGALPDGARGRMLLVMVGQDMPELASTVQQVWVSVQQAAGLAGPAVLETIQQGGGFPAAVHLMDAIGNATERLAWYAAADVQVLNAECETFGRVTVEGMGASLPLLATACGGSLEIVQDGVTGLLHPSPSEGEASDAALVDHILRLDRRTAAGRALGEQLGGAGCRRVHAEFRPQMFLAAAETLLRQVADGAAAAQAAAAAGLGAAPGEGLAPEAATGLPSGWASAFMPAPANQARMLGRDMHWAWEELPGAPLVAYESTGFQVGGMLFVLNGFALRRNAAGMAAHALLSVNLDSLRWQDLSGEVPADMAETHRASALVGGRHAFLVAGQKGAACSPATSAAYRLDLQTLQLRAIPSLPQPRYAPALALLGDGRLHLFGGLMPDRTTPARDHWSLAVNADGSAGDAWVAEPLLPAHLGGSHGTVVQLQPRGAAEPALYFWGRISQEFRPRDAAAGDPTCVADREWGDAALWSFNPRRGWRRHRDLPLPLLHASGCTVKLGQDAALVVGGQHYAGWLSRTLWLYNATQDSWARVGHAPLYGRGQVCALHGGRLFLALGQQGQENGLSPDLGPLSARQFWAALPPELAAAAASPDAGGGVAWRQQ